MQRTTIRGMAQHVISVCNNGRELGYQVNTLTHQVIARSIIRLRVKTVHFKHATGQNVHNVISLQLDDIHFGFLFQRGIIINQLTERCQLLLVRQMTGQQQISHFLKTKTFLLNDAMCQIFQIIPTIEKFAGDRLQTSTGNTFIPYYVTYLGQPYQNTCTVLVTQSTLHVKLGEQFIVNPGCLFHLLGELVNDIFFLHIREFLGVYSFYDFFCKC